MLKSPSAGLGTFLRQLASHNDSKVTDADLLAAFVEEKDIVAFEKILLRHKDWVFGVCRRLLQHQQDSEDAFQATFLVLFLKADSIQDRQTLACWLYKVAFRIAMKAKMRTKHRRQTESQIVRPLVQESSELVNWEKLEAILDQEIHALPEKYQKAIVLCDLEGKSRREASQLLKCKEGTLSGYLTRGRRLLAQRLQRYGFSCSVTSLGFLVTQKVSAEKAPYSLVHQTTELIQRLGTSNGIVLDWVPDPVATLTKGVLKSMLLTQVRNITAILIPVITALMVGFGSFTGQAAPVPTAKTGTSKEVTDFLAKWKINHPQLLQDHKVIRELKCTLEQREKIEDLFDVRDEKVPGLNQKLQTLLSDPSLNGADLENAVKKTRDEIFHESEKAMKEIQEKVLKPDQVHRLRQIDLQSLGSLAFTFSFSHIDQTLKLTDQQKEEIQKLKKKAFESVNEQVPALPRRVFGAAPIPQVGKPILPDELEKKDRELVQSILELLTKDQQALWNEMIGKPAKFRRTSFGIFDGFANSGKQMQLPPVAQQIKAPLAQPFNIPLPPKP